MSRFFSRLVLSGVMACAIFANVAAAETKNFLFDVHLLGIKAGELSYSVKFEGDRYSAAGKLFPTGIAATLVTFLFDVTVSGTRNGERYTPKKYTEISDTGKRQEEKTLTYSNGIARVKSPKLAKPHWANPKDHKNALDPMTAIFWVLDDRTKENLCKQSVPIFDGARRVNIVLSNPKIAGKSATCDGIYQRIDGFSQNELKEGKNFPFTLTYAIDGENFKLSRFDVQSVRGRAAFVRR